MKTLVLFCALFALLIPASAAPDHIGACRAADDARVAAMIAADHAKLAAVFSDELIYVHSNGHQDTKTSLTAALTSGKAVYHAIDFEQREFR